MYTRAFARILGVLWVGAACSDWYTPVRVVDLLCDANTDFVVGPGTQPEVGWTTDCRVHGLELLALPRNSAEPPEWVWQFQTNGRPIVGPIRLGEAREEPLSTPWVVELELGREYELWVVQPGPMPSTASHDMAVRFVAR